jgi:hypothetical protein
VQIHVLQTNAEHTVQEANTLVREWINRIQFQQLALSRWLRLVGEKRSEGMHIQYNIVMRALGIASLDCVF